MLRLYRRFPINGSNDNRQSMETLLYIAVLIRP